MESFLKMECPSVHKEPAHLDMFFNFTVKSRSTSVSKIFIFISLSLFLSLSLSVSLSHLSETSRREYIGAFSAVWTHIPAMTHEERERKSESVCERERERERSCEPTHIFKEADDGDFQFAAKRDFPPHVTDGDKLKTHTQ